MKDDFGRSIDYLRISLTDRCNFRCNYCMPEEGVRMLSHNDILSYEEILQIVSIAGTLGISKIRLTGGEPLVRKGIFEFVSKLKAIEQIESISMTTNGFLLGECAKDLKDSGIDRVNISLDTLESSRFQVITRRDGLKNVLNGIDAALAAGLNPVKINTVIMRGVNDDEIIPMIRFASEKGLVLRFIEQMPFNHAGKETFMAASEIMAVIEREFGKPEPFREESLLHFKGFGPSELFHFGKSGPIAGFISPVSNHFCNRCNRMRLTADGKLKPCLLSDEEIDLRTALRNGSPRRELEGIVRYAIERKPERHRLNESGFESIRGMSKIGG